MTPLVAAKEIAKAFGPRELFHELSAAIFSGDRIGLVGPNGAGKSTLLKLFAGLESPDSGELIFSKGVTVGYVTQQVEELTGTCEEVVLAAAETLVALSPQERYARSRQVLSTLGFEDPAQEAATLSGGRKRRLTIARALVKEPDLLLLDEPTNHLDLESILWLENFLRRKGITFIATSHDRAFLETVSTRMWEISHRYPRGIFTAEGGYSDFLEQRTAFLEGQQQRERGLRSKLRREEEWLKQSPKARTTKARSRIQEAARLQHELARLKYRNREGKSRLELTGTGRETKKLLSAKGISKTLGERTLFANLDLTLYRGERIGIAGENGSGKSTLLKVLAGELSPDSGTVKLADGLTLTLFDQHREQLDLSQTLREGLAPEGDSVRVNRQNIHVNSWAERFLFPKERLDLPMNRLSGGERARVLIARLMTEPADILLLDEPTNDLDIDTLEVLESGLDEFPGAVILVTHDRAMMDRVVDELVAVDSEPAGRRFNETDAWLSWRQEQRRQPTATTPKPKKPAAPKSNLSYQERKELASVERRIEKLEGELEKEGEKLNDLSSQEEIDKQCKVIAEKQQELDKHYERWQELELRSSGEPTNP